MKDKPENKNFLSKDIVIKIYKDLKDADVETKIKALHEYADSVKDRFKADHIQFEIDKQKAFLYYDHQQYATALPHIIKVLSAESAYTTESSEHLYSLLRIRCHRLLHQYEEGMICFKNRLSQLKESDSAFMLLDLLEDYANLCREAPFAFEESYQTLIEQIVSKLAFPAIDLPPLERILAMTKMHLHWNRKISQIHMIRTNDLEKAKQLEDYIATCEIGWYKAYAERIKAGLEAKVSPPSNQA